MRWHFHTLLAIILCASQPALAGAGSAPAATATVAPRTIPLDQGSNMRDLGGYPGAGHRTLRTGWIYRSGAMPLLSEADYARLASLHIRSIVDFRSIEERQLAPTLLDDRTGALFISNDYPFSAMAIGLHRDGQGRFTADLYREFPRLFIPQYRALFNRLLAHDGAVLFNCSAGQDRTGTAAALVLSALGTPRDVIVADYLASTDLRRPQWEMPPISAARFPGNAVATFYEHAQQAPGGMRAERLVAADGQPYLLGFFAAIEQEWGSVDAYLHKEMGLTPADIRKLRHLYLQ